MTRPKREDVPPHLAGYVGDPAQKLPPALRRGPSIILVETQMGENIGATARAMANFGLKDLRLVRPRDGWPNERARAAASRGDGIIDAVSMFDTLEDAISDLNLVFSTTARSQDIAKRVVTPAQAASEGMATINAGERVGLVFGRERWGLTNDEVGLTDAILTIPVDPELASLNIAQAVIVCAYEWRQHLLAIAHGPAVAVEGARADWTPFVEKERAPLASKDALLGLFGHLETALDAVSFFRPDHKRGHMVRNLRQVFLKARLTDQEVRTLRGVIAALERRPTRRDLAQTPADGDQTHAAPEASSAGDP